MNPDEQIAVSVLSVFISIGTMFYAATIVGGRSTLPIPMRFLRPMLSSNGKLIAAALDKWCVDYSLDAKDEHYDRPVRVMVEQYASSGPFFDRLILLRMERVLEKQEHQRMRIAHSREIAGKILMGELKCP